MLQLAIYCALFLALYFNSVPGFFLVFFGCFFVSETKDRKIAVLAVVNFGFLLTEYAFSHRIFHHDILYMISIGEDKFHVPWVLLTIRCCALALLLGFSVLAHYLYEKLGRRYLVTLHLTMFHIPLMGYYLFCSSVPVRLLCAALAIVYGKYFWSILYTQAVLSRRESGKLTTFFSILPFWSFFTSNHINAMPRGFGELVSCQGHSEQEKRKNQISGLKLMYFGLAFKMANDRLWSILMAVDLPIRYFPTTGLKAMNMMHLPFYWMWMNDFVNGFSFILWNVWAVSVIVGVVRFCGFRIPLAMQGIHLSRSWNDFLKRIYYYYSEAIVYFFYFPTQKLLGGNKPSRFRAALVSFVSLLSGGLVAHLLIEVQYGLGNSPLHYLVALAKFSPYLIGLATMAAISSYRHVYRKPNVWRLLPTTGYFLIYFVCLAAHGWYLDSRYEALDKGAFNDYLTFIMSHFGISN